MFEAIDKALQKGMRAQFVTMGSGIEELEEVAAELEEKYPKAYKAVLSFKGAEKYKTYAAADFALMPSRYEPCGLVQMEGMRFGTLPIVAPTGGLADTVKDMKTGLVMEHEVDQDGIEEVDVDMLVKNMERAVSLFESKETLRKIQVDAMAAAKSYSWNASAKQYVSHFLQIGAATSWTSTAHQRSSPAGWRDVCAGVEDADHTSRMSYLVKSRVSHALPTDRPSAAPDPPDACAQLELFLPPSMVQVFLLPHVPPSPSCSMRSPG
eukprot:1746850-Rhodomonas_salina.2